MGASRLSCSTSSLIEIGNGSRRFSNAPRDSSFFNRIVVVVVVEQVRNFRNEQDDGIRVSNLIIVDAFT